MLHELKGRISRETRLKTKVFRIDLAPSEYSQPMAATQLHIELSRYKRVCRLVYFSSADDGRYQVENHSCIKPSLNVAAWSSEKLVFEDDKGPGKVIIWRKAWAEKCRH